MTPRRRAVLAWVVPLLVAAALGTLAVLDDAVAWPAEPEGEPPPCYGTEDGETICPDDDRPIPQPSALRRVVTTLNSESVKGAILGLGSLGALAAAISAIVSTHKTRSSSADDRLTFRIAVSALVVGLLLPALAGLFLLFAIASFPIRG